MNDINLCDIKNSLFFKRVSSKKEVSKKDSCDGYLLDTSEKEARRIIESLKNSGKLFAFIGGDNTLNRRAIEKLRINFLVSPEQGKKKDTLKQRDSGLNHVVAKEAVRKKVSIIIDLSTITPLPKKEKVKRFSRIIQNIIICRKAHCPIKIVNFSSTKQNIMGTKERETFGISLGMSSQQAKQATIIK